MPRSLTYVKPRKRLYPFQCPKMIACPCPEEQPGSLEVPSLEGRGIVALSPDHLRMKGQLAKASGQYGEGVGRKRVNEPLHSNASKVKQNIPRSDDGRIPQVKEYGTVRTVPIITEPERKQQQSGEGLEKEDFDLLPGDALKMKLIRKLACQTKQTKLKKKHIASKKINLDKVIEKLFPILLKQVDPKAAVFLHSDKAGKAISGLKKIIKSSVKSPKPDRATAKGIASVFIDVFKKMGRDVPDNAENVLINEILSALFRMESGTMVGSGKKHKQFWRDFGRSFAKTLKVGLPIAAVIAPELAPVAMAAEMLL